MNLSNYPPGVSGNEPELTGERSELRTYTVNGLNYRAHPSCRDGFYEDRTRTSLIYPSFNVDGEIMGVENASMAGEFCAYCEHNTN